MSLFSALFASVSRQLAGPTPPPLLGKSGSGVRFAGAAGCETTRFLARAADSERVIQRAGYAVDEPTIVFMPHCDLHLYENLFRENWTQARLPNLVLIANRLSEYAEK